MTAVIAAVLPVLFLALGVLRAYPFVDDVRVPAVSGDDWHTYKQLALSVVRDGLSMPAVTATYADLPHGFLYIYFVAAIFALLGVNSTYVYVVQSAALGLSISLTYGAVRKRLTPTGGLAFLLTLAAVMYVDVFRHLTFRLLSENLYFLLFPLFLVLLFRSLDPPDGGRRHAFWAGAILGLVVLTRPSFILSAATVIALVWIYSFAKSRSSRVPALMLLGVAMGLSGVVARNYAMTGRVTFDIVTNTSDWNRSWNLPVVPFVITVVKRSLFVFGWTGLIAPAYRWRPHWMMMWVLWLVYPAFRAAKRQPIEFWELLLYLYVMCYIVPVVLVADITSYGGRMVITILPVVLIPVFRLFFRYEAPRQRESREQALRC